MNTLDIYAEIFLLIKQKRAKYIEYVSQMNQHQSENISYKFSKFITNTGFLKGKPYVSVTSVDTSEKYVVTETISAREYETIRDVLVYKIYSQMLLEYGDFARTLENDANNILAFMNGDNVDFERNSTWLFPHNIQIAKKMHKKRKKYEKHCTIECKYL